jgi:hypothetical protein
MHWPPEAVVFQLDMGERLAGMLVEDPCDQGTKLQILLTRRISQPQVPRAIVVPRYSHGQEHAVSSCFRSLYIRQFLCGFCVPVLSIAPR